MTPHFTGLWVRGIAIKITVVEEWDFVLKGLNLAKRVVKFGGYPSRLVVAYESHNSDRNLGHRIPKNYACDSYGVAVLTIAAGL